MWLYWHGFGFSGTTQQNVSPESGTEKERDYEKLITGKMDGPVYES